MQTEFSYSVTLEDTLRFAEHIYRTSPKFRRPRLFWCIFAPSVFIFWTIHHYWDIQRFDGLCLFLALVSMTAVLFLPRQYDRLELRRIFRHCLRPDVDTGSLRLVVTDDSITEISSSRRITLAWNQVPKIEIQTDHIYVYTSLDCGIVIPRHSFESGQSYADLQRDVARRFQNKSV